MTMDHEAKAREFLLTSGIACQTMRRDEVCGFKDRCDCRKWNSALAALLAEVAGEAKASETEACAAIADRRAEPTNECERLHYDASCNGWECSRENRGGDCLCIERQEEAEAIAAAIRKRAPAVTPSV